jgi:predicted transcriptional regulator of viral defense system
LFGTRGVWRHGTTVAISDRERTLVDCLDDPSLAGGLSGTGEALRSYGCRSGVAWPRLVEYGERLGRLSVFNRLGYLAESLGFGDGWLIEACLARACAGEERLDPERPATGRLDGRWALRVNVGL